MPGPDRIVNFSIGRVATDGTDVDTGTLSDTIYGQVSNIAGGDVTYEYNTSSTGDADDRYWNGRFALTDLTFTLHKASEDVDSLGPAEIVLDIEYDWFAGTDRKSKVIRYRGGFSTTTRTFDRTTDSPTECTFVPYQRIKGGGETMDALTQDTAAHYADTRAQELSYRVGGTGTVVHVTRTNRTAHTG